MTFIHKRKERTELRVDPRDGQVWKTRRHAKHNFTVVCWATIDGIDTITNVPRLMWDSWETR